jgi:hypothetical protein
MELAILLAILICPLTMGAMMLFMMRGMRGGGRDADQNDRSDVRLPEASSRDEPA